MCVCGGGGGGGYRLGLPGPGAGETGSRYTVVAQLLGDLVVPALCLIIS